MLGDWTAPLLTLLAYTMVLVALGISSSSTLHQMVALYRVQASILTVVVILRSAREPVLLLLALVPATLAVLAPALLARASLNTRAPDPATPLRRGWQRVAWRAVWSLRDARSRAEPIWLGHGRSRLEGGRAAAIDVAVLAAAVLVAGRIVNEGAADQPASAHYTVTLALLVQGMFTMVNKRDIIAQVVGLLVIDHALLLAAVLLAPPGLAPTVVLGLLFYVVVTLTILVWMLPALHRASGSIEVGANTTLRGRP
jgi:hydrogenase-4 membrane subunit HyfE